MNEVELINKADVENFFNNYKTNLNRIVYLEQKLLKESYNFDKLQSTIRENSNLTRSLFTENRDLLNRYVKNIIDEPEKLSPMAAKNYLLHVLFFLFENYNDDFVAIEIVKAISNCSYSKNDKMQFDINMDLGIADIYSAQHSPEFTSNRLEKAISIFPCIEEIDDDIIRIHLSFCYLFKILNEVLREKPNFDVMVRDIKHHKEMIKKFSKNVYAQMWAGENVDYNFHVELLDRYYKANTVIAFAITDFGSDYKLNTEVQQWIKEEYARECDEGKINSSVYYAFYKLQYLLGEITKDQFVERLEDRYKVIREVVTKKYSFSNSSICDDNEPVPAQFAKILDTTKIMSETFGFVFVLVQNLYQLTQDYTLFDYLKSDTEQFYLQIPYDDSGINMDPFIIKNVKIFLKKARSTTECVNFLQTVFLHRQISTAIHLSMVGKLATLCYEHFSATRPDLFAHVPGFETKESAIQFIKEAAFFHDIGKLFCTNLINLHTRDITANERSLIYLHSQKGADLISEIPLISKYRDIVLGHHKFYNGREGYPATFDNTKSVYRPVIDLITLCDCMDAATDKCGRNYARAKDFDSFFVEIKNLAGSRYNPVYIDLIENTPALKTKLKDMTGLRRVDLYYEMYKQHISPNITFIAEDKKIVREYTEDDLPKVQDFYREVYGNKTSERKILIYLDNILSAQNLRAYILCDGFQRIYGVLFGRETVDLNEDKIYFIIDDIVVDPELRRKGYGTQLLNFVQRDLKENGITEIRSDVVKNFNEESFFWLNGFKETETQLMKKYFGD